MRESTVVSLAFIIAIKIFALIIVRVVTLFLLIALSSLKVFTHWQHKVSWMNERTSLPIFTIAFTKLYVKYLS